MATKLILEVYDEKDEAWGSGVRRLEGRLRAAHAIAETSVSEMVDELLRIVKEQEGSIYRLHIKGHGASGMQSVGGGKSGRLVRGKQGLTHANLSVHRDVLAQLTEHFDREAIVTLEGCNVGLGADGTRLLKALSEIWGVPVQAGVDTQYAVVPGLEGAVKRCTPVSCSLFESTWFGSPDHDDDPLPYVPQGKRGPRLEPKASQEKYSEKYSKKYAK